MKIDANTFKLCEGDEVDLGLWTTNVKPLCKSKKKYHKVLQDQVDQLSDQQRLLYASNRHALLLVLQATDTAGKDGAIRHVMSGVNPQGCQVFSFAHPSAQELQHDFLWRTTRDLPERGRIGNQRHDEQEVHCGGRQALDGGHPRQSKVVLPIGRTLFAILVLPLIASTKLLWLRAHQVDADWRKPLCY